MITFVGGLPFPVEMTRNALSAAVPFPAAFFMQLATYVAFFAIKICSMSINEIYFCAHQAASNIIIVMSNIIYLRCAAALLRRRR